MSEQDWGYIVFAFMMYHFVFNQNWSINRKIRDLESDIERLKK